MLKLLAFVLPLGLDSFAVAAAIGAIQVTTLRQRLRVSLVFVVFEAGMPLIGLGLGAALARGIGHVANYLAAAAVIGIGAWMLLAGESDDEERAGRLTGSHGLTGHSGSASAWMSWPSDSPLAWYACPSLPLSWPSPSRRSWPRNSAWR
jgi:putative Mn2+ efflux pump MntP